MYIETFPEPGAPQGAIYIILLIRLYYMIELYSVTVWPGCTIQREWISAEHISVPSRWIELLKIKCCRCTSLFSESRSENKDASLQQQGRESETWTIASFLCRTFPLRVRACLSAILLTPRRAITSSNGSDAKTPGSTSMALKNINPSPTFSLNLH